MTIRVFPHPMAVLPNTLPCRTSSGWSSTLTLAAVVLLALVSLSSAAAAQQAELPPVAAAGLAAFEQAGADSAIAVWLRGTSMDTPATRASLGQGFARMAEQTGTMLGYDVVRVFPIGTHVRRVYAVLHYERGPAYLFMELYRTPDDWMMQSVQFNAAAEDVFPSALLRP